jgi:hypothetical protein
MKLLLNFLPIILIFLLVTYTPEMAQTSHTVLGKLVAVAVILLYTKIDTLSGLLVTALVILYYQSDYVESFEPVKERYMNLSKIAPSEVSHQLNHSIEKESNIPLDISLELLTDAYSDKVPVNNSDVKSFRQINCSKGHLIHKGQIVKPEMAEHVFPEIKQNNFHKCNICDHNCEFNFIDKQLNVQEDLVKPKSSKDVIDTK